MVSYKSTKGKGVDCDRQSNHSLSLSEYHYMVPQESSFGSPRAFIPPELPQARYQHDPPPNNYHRDTKQPASPGTSHSQYWPSQNDVWTPGFGYRNRDGYGESRAERGYKEETGSVMSSGTAASVSGSAWDSVSTCSDMTVTTMRGTLPPSSVSSRASTAPSRHSNRSTVDTHINRQPPARRQYELPCEFCDEVFSGNEDYAWKEHTESHLGGSYPARVKCWFCDDLGMYDANTRANGDRWSNFHLRMDHVRDHILDGDYRAEDRRVDGFMVHHLRRKGLIDEETYQRMLRPTNPPPARPSSPPHARGQRQLAPVVEIAGSSSRSREHHSHRRNNDGHRMSDRDPHHRGR